MLHFFEKGQGHPLLLLHGFCESGEMWHYFADSLSTQYRVICPDLPGFGNSPLTHPIHSLEEVAEQLEGVGHLGMVEEKEKSLAVVQNFVGEVLK